MKARSASWGQRCGKRNVLGEGTNGCGGGLLLGVGLGTSNSKGPSPGPTARWSRWPRGRLGDKRRLQTATPAISLGEKPLFSTTPFDNLRQARPPVVLIPARPVLGAGTLSRTRRRGPSAASPPVEDTDPHLARPVIQDVVIGSPVPDRTRHGRSAFFQLVGASPRAVSSLIWMSARAWAMGRVAG